MLIILIFAHFPPLLLLLYLTRLFRKCLICCGFHVFQGWYKDETKRTYDYRPLSTLYMLQRMTFSFAYCVYLQTILHIHVCAFHYPVRYIASTTLEQARAMLYRSLFGTRVCICDQNPIYLSISMVALASTKYDLRLFEVINSWDALCITGMTFLAFKLYKVNWMNHMMVNKYFLASGILFTGICQWFTLK